MQTPDATLPVNYPSSTNISGAYYGPPPSGLQIVNATVHSYVDSPYNATYDQFSGSIWNNLWTCWYNSPDHQGVYEGNDYGYQYNYSLFLRSPPVANSGAMNDTDLFISSFALNDSVTLWQPGDLVLWQAIEVEADNTTATGRRAFSPLFRIVANETEGSASTSTAVTGSASTSTTVTGTATSTSTPTMTGGSAASSGSKAKRLLGIAAALAVFCVVHF